MEHGIPNALWCICCLKAAVFKAFKIKNNPEYRKVVRMIDKISVIDGLDENEMEKTVPDIIRNFLPPDNTRMALALISNSPEKFLCRAEKRQNDSEIFAYHLLSGGDVFVTNDRKGIFQDRKRLEGLYKTKIRLLDEDFLDELELCHLSFS
ncbi:MAG: hypothetical protein HYY37_05490 [Candidatus Aenigmarchaeota archaeon]|nr:hypothetical protein [Candidatus Aenigmarchaeota archaeon]